MPIYFHKEDASIALKKIKVIKRWLEDVVSFYNKEMGVINVVFCSDDFLLKINKEYLNYIQKKKEQEELLKTTPVQLNPFYKEKVNKYFNTISEE